MFSEKDKGRVKYINVCEYERSVNMIDILNPVSM